MQKTIPDHSPLLLVNLACHACGEVMEPEIVKNSRGVVDFIRYTHRNEKTGCSYTLETNAMITAEMKAKRVDGAPVKL